MNLHELQLTWAGRVALRLPRPLSLLWIRVVMNVFHKGVMKRVAV